MEILTVKNNKIDYLTLKKVVFYTFPTYYILSLVAMFCGALIALFINLYTGDIIEIATCIIICSYNTSYSIKNERKKIHKST